MYAAVMPIGSDSSLGWTSIRKTEQTAENGPAWLSSRVSTEQTYPDCITHKNLGRIEIFVILLGKASVKFDGILAMDDEEASTGIVGSRNSLRTERRLAIGQTFCGEWNYRELELVLSPSVLFDSLLWIGILPSLVAVATRGKRKARVCEAPT